MNDRAVFLDDLAAQGVPIGTAEPAGPDLIIWPGNVPYGVELAPQALKPEWLKAGDVHMIRSNRVPGTYRIDGLRFDDRGRLLIGNKPLRLTAIAFITLYPAPVHIPGLSPAA